MTMIPQPSSESTAAPNLDETANRQPSFKDAAEPDGPVYGPLVTPLAISGGGTGASTAAQALDNLGGLPVIATIASLESATSATLPDSGCCVLVYSTGAYGGGIFYVGANATANAGTIINDASGRSWYRTIDSNEYSAFWFGADPTKTTDSTAAFNKLFSSASAAGASALIPAGHYLVSSLSTITGTIAIRGEGEKNTLLFTTSATANIMTVSGGWTTLSNIGFDSTVTRTNGAYLTVTTDGLFENLYFNDWFMGILAEGNVGTFRDIQWNQAASAGSIGIQVNGYQGALLIDNPMFYVSSTTPFYGINLVNCGAAQIVNANILEVGTSLLINPGNGQAVASVFCTNCFFDNAIDYAVGILPSGTGSVTRCTFTQCWMSSTHNYAGVIIDNGGTGSISGLCFDNCTMVLNKGNGIQVSSAMSDLRITGGVYAGNSGSGIVVAAPVTGMTITNVAAGAYAGVPGNVGYGIYNAGVATNDYIISLCRTAGNTAGSLADFGTGSTKYVGNNIA